jgi:hypothetical protein
MKTKHIALLICLLINAFFVSCCSYQERVLSRQISKVKTLDDFQKLPDTIQNYLSWMIQEVVFTYSGVNFENPDNGLDLKNYVPPYDRALKKFFYNNLKFISVKEYNIPVQEYNYCSDTTTNITYTDSLVIYYYDFPVWRSVNWGIPIDCNTIFEYFQFVINFFDTKERYFENRTLYKDFCTAWVEIAKDFQYGKGYEPLLYPKDTFYTLSSGRPRLILYKYDNVNGFSIAKTCYEEYAQYQNDYTEALCKNAEAFCKKHKLSKVIFGAYLMVKKEND